MDPYFPPCANGEFGTPAVVAVDVGIPLLDYIDLKPMIVKVGPSLSEDGFVVLPGETDPTTVYSIATEQSKILIRSLLKVLKQNEDAAICFEHFDSTNIIVSRARTVKFRNVTILRNLPEARFADHTRSNYLSASKIITDLFGGSPPPEFGHLIELINLQYQYRSMFYMHAALISMASFAGMFKEHYDLLRTVLDRNVLRDILKTLPHAAGWTSGIQTNDRLMRPYNYNIRSYTVPADKPTQTCLNKDHKGYLDALGLTPAPGQRTLSNEEKELIEALQFIDYLRNRSSRRMDFYRDWVKNNRREYRAQGSELVTNLRYPMVLPHIQFEIYKRGKMSHVSMREYY